MADGDTMLYIDGSKNAFRCSCGANVFTRISNKGAPVQKFQCNGCYTLYEGTETKGIEKMKVLDPETIRKECLRKMRTGQPVEFKNKAQFAVRTLFIETLRQNAQIKNVDEARYLIWGYVFAEDEKPFKMLHSRDLTPAMWNALGKWSTERIGGEYKLRESFPEELGWVLTRARVALTFTDYSENKLSFGEFVKRYPNQTGPIEINSPADRGDASQAMLTDQMGFLLQAGGDVSQSFEAKEEPAPVPPVAKPTEQQKEVESFALNLEF